MAEDGYELLSKLGSLMLFEQPSLSELSFSLGGLFRGDEIALISPAFGCLNQRYASE